MNKSYDAEGIFEKIEFVEEEGNGSKFISIIIANQMNINMKICIVEIFFYGAKKKNKQP